MERLSLIKQQLSNSKLSNHSDKKQKIVSSAIDYLLFEEILNKEEKEYLKKFREYLKKEVEVQINKYIEKKEFAKEIIMGIVKNFPGIMGFSIKGYQCAGYSQWLTYCLLMELSKIDVSLATFFVVNGGELIIKTIFTLGNEQQKQFYIPKLVNFEFVGSFCLTEPDYGSDASSIKTSTKEFDDHYILNGQKRWIGNGTIAGVLIVFARNEKTNHVEGYLVDPKSKGVEAKLIDGKLSTRGVMNADISFTNVVIPKENKLEKANDFKNGTNKMLFGSRLAVAWIAAGACIGAYDKVIEYCSNRKQFGKSLTSFQLIQDKLARIMGNTQAIIYFCKRATEIYMQNKLSLGQVGLLKAWVTHTARQTLLIAREALGGNGILIDNYVMKTLLDLESVHTYEGTADINLLVCAKELTGISSFK
jgi:acyl-CoA oxidase